MIKKIIAKVDKVLFKGKLRSLYTKIRLYKNSKKTSSFFGGKKNVVLKEPIYDMILMQYIDRDYSAYAFYDLAVRTLAIEEYYGKNTVGFELYKKMHTLGGNYGQENQAEFYYAKMQKKKKTPRHGAYPEQHSIEQFSSLIKSIDENGYDNNSIVMADRNLLSINGSHRVAISLYKDWEYIKIDVHNVAFKRRFVKDWFWANHFTHDEMKILDIKMDSIINHCKQKIGDYYCILFPPAEDYFDDITKDILVIDPNNIIMDGYHDYEWEVEDLKGFLRGVYYFDSIKTSDFIRKLFYIFKASKPVDGKVKFRIVSIKINSPMYRLKNDNGMPESLATVRLKQVIRQRYKDKEPRFTEHYVGDYAHDVIIHSSDNYISNKAFRDLLSMPKDLTVVFRTLKKFNYAIAASSSDKISSDFPRNYYFYEDFDIFVNDEDLQDISDSAYFSLQTVFTNKDNVIVSKETRDNGIRVRTTYNGFTITTLDFMTSFRGIKHNMIKTFVEEKRGDDYYFLSLENEIIYRINAFLNSPNKQYHKDFIIANIGLCSKDRIISAFEDNRVEQVIKLLASINADKKN